MGPNNQKIGRFDINISAKERKKKVSTNKDRVRQTTGNKQHS